MAKIQIFTETEAKVFDSPPVFSKEDQQKFFHLTSEIKSLVDKIKSPVNQLGFVLQLGYMRYANRFFNLNTFKKGDILFLSQRFGFEVEGFQINRYKTTAYKRHRRIILDIIRSL